MEKVLKSVRIACQIRNAGLSIAQMLHLLQFFTLEKYSTCTMSWNRGPLAVYFKVMFW